MKCVLVLVVIAVLAAFLYSIAYGTERERLTITPDTPTCAPNEMITFTCSGHVQYVAWQLNGIDISISGEHYYIENLSLRITCLLEWNNTNVSCSEGTGARSLPATIRIHMPEPRVSPDDQICYLNQSIVLTCNGVFGAAAGWYHNDSAIQLSDNDHRFSVIGSHRLEVNCFLELNNSMFKCFEALDNRSWNSTPVSLKIQGLLGPVSDLVYLPHNQTLSWKPPFQLNTSQAITYNILVTKITEDRLIVDSNNQPEMYLDLTGQLEQGSTYNVSLWPLNAVGRGQETSVVFTEEPATTSSSMITGSDGTTSAPPNDPNKQTSETGIIVGGVVAVVLVVIAVVVILILVMICRSRGGRHVVSETRSPVEQEDGCVMETSSSSQEQDASQRGFLTGTSPSDGQKDSAVRKRRMK